MKPPNLRDLQKGEAVLAGIVRQAKDAIEASEDDCARHAAKSEADWAPYVKTTEPTRRTGR